VQKSGIQIEDRLSKEEAVQIEMALSEQPLAGEHKIAILRLISPIIESR
jgi:hypothetical protein